MSNSHRKTWHFVRLIALLCAVGGAVFSMGITWGLPTREVDRFLFGGREPWSGETIIKLAPKRQTGAAQGADVDTNPLNAKAATEPISLNNTDAQRAEIIRRYRLYTYQPDEMITMMALSSMKPGALDLDPKLYQYGGLWIYPVGAMLKAASVFGWISLRTGPDAMAWYLDHPEQFGRFYVVARAYVVLWGLIGVVACFYLARRIVGTTTAGAAAALAFIFLPVVVNMAHEAKPHLPGAVLILLAVLAGSKFVRKGRTRDAAIAGTLCGAALAMVLSTLPVFAILPVMVLMRSDAWKSRLRMMFIATAAGVAIYAITNPYVVIHLATGGGALKSNLANSKAFYHAGDLAKGTWNVIRLIGEGASLPIAAAGALGTVVLGVRAIVKRNDATDAERRRRSTGLLLAVPAVITFVQAAIVAEGKPGEFGRFLLLTDIFLAMETVAMILTFLRPVPARLLLAVLLTFNAWAGAQYLRGFLHDSDRETSRIAMAMEIDQLRRNGVQTISLTAEPAPYAVPPVNLFDWHIELLPPNHLPAPGQEDRPTIRVVDGPTPISWADKPVILTGTGSETEERPD